MRAARPCWLATYAKRVPSGEIATDGPAVSCGTNWPGGSEIAIREHGKGVPVGATALNPHIITITTIRRASAAVVHASARDGAAETRSATGTLVAVRPESESRFSRARSARSSAALWCPEAPILFQQLVDDPFELRREIRVHTARCDRLFADDAVEDGGGGIPLERQASGRHLIEYDSQGEEIGSRVDFGTGRAPAPETYMPRCLGRCRVW